MKLKRFLFIFCVFCAFQMPFACFAAKLTVDLRAGEAVPLYDTEDQDPEQIFTFDPKLAPIKLEYVDFKIDRGRNAEEWGKNIGQYQFKLFGCKRADKNIVLNQGRAMKRDMKFGDVFFEQMNELFPVVVNKDSPYFPYSIGDKAPGYIITAEIKDLFVNVCDQYDWRTREYSQLRSGSAEIKVLWRVMTPYNRKLYWEDTTRGYAELTTPVRAGEVKLVEKAFADALIRVIGMPGFLQTMRERPDEKMLAKAKADFDAMAYQHLVKRKNLVSSYRRRRMKFYTERQREKILNDMEKLAPTKKSLAELFERGELDETTLDEIMRKKAMGLDLTPEELELLEAAKQKELAGHGLSDGQGYGVSGKGLSDDQESGIMARGLNDPGQNAIIGKLLTDTPLERNFFGRLIDSSPLLKFMEDSILPSDLNRENKKYGFIISPVDGWITINNQKPFRYLSPSRIYRIRASIVAVTNEDEVGSGLLISPALILTNYQVVKKSPYVKIEFLDGRTASGIVLRASSEKDVALVYMPPENFSQVNWPIPLRIDLPDVGEPFYAIGTPMRGGFEGAMESGKIAGYRYSNSGVDILTTTNVQSVTLGGVLVDDSGNAVGLAHSGESLADNRDGFIPVGDAFDALKVRIRDRDMDETPYQKALRLKKMRDRYIK